MVRRSIAIAALLAAGLALGGCGSINSSLSASMADGIPHWAGGLPADAPPRAGEPGYAAYLAKLNAKAVVEPAKANAGAAVAKSAD